ncbi:MAG TPA: hypothetical protein VFH27_04515, partial [Longimicrobiaceae bacterium]|nr:hypothetical protein [Longimicrobiaceae bacterium]
SFSDGAFYVGRLRPGEYEVRISESSLRALGARAVPATTPLTVPAAGRDALIELPRIRLERP